MSKYRILQTTTNRYLVQEYTYLHWRTCKNSRKHIRIFHTIDQAKQCVEDLKSTDWLHKININNQIDYTIKVVATYD